METLSEYAKYTIALAVAVLLYVPAQFLPNEVWWQSALLQGTVITAGASALFGLMLYTRVTTIIVKGEQNQDYVALWGALHMYTLLACFAVTAGFFISFKVFGATEAPDCSFALQDDAGRAVTVTLPCSIEAGGR